MKKLYILTILLCLTGFGSIFAQTLKGHIYDAKTNEPLVGATVTYKLHGNQGVVCLLYTSNTYSTPLTVELTTTCAPLEDTSTPETPLLTAAVVPL